LKIEYDPAKRADTLAQRGLDMALAFLVFEGPHLTVEDDRKDHGETRLVTVGYLEGRLVYIAWTQRGDTRRIISLGCANDLEIARSRL
jgi:uncharacterized protein